MHYFFMTVICLEMEWLMILWHCTYHMQFDIFADNNHRDRCLQIDITIARGNTV